MALSCSNFSNSAVTLSGISSLLSCTGVPAAGVVGEGWACGDCSRPRPKPAGAPIRIRQNN